jgi:hypothetical protein
MWWFNAVCSLGSQKPLEVKDLYALNPEDTSTVLVPRWEQLWNSAIAGLLFNKLITCKRGFTKAESESSDTNTTISHMRLCLRIQA